jgi:hypothetical protein
MSTATATPIRRRPSVAELERLDPARREAPAAFLAAVVAYRERFWALRDRPARDAFNFADDGAGLRWWKALPGSKVAVLEMLREHWLEDVAAGLRERDRFVKAVRESALGVIR